jgi:hypothetical protein
MNPHSWIESDRRRPSSWVKATLQASPAQRHHESAAKDELVPPGGREVPCPTVTNDAVVGGVVRLAERPVTRGHVHVTVSGRIQRLPGLHGRLWIDVDAGDLPGRSGQVCQKGGVIARPGTDLQDSVARADVELVKHHGDDGGLGRAAQGSAVTATLDDHALAGVCLLDSGDGNKLVAGDRPQGLLDTAGPGMASFQDVVDHAGAQSLRRSAGGGYGNVHRIPSKRFHQKGKRRTIL